MKEVKYRYCRDEHYNLIDVESLTKENKHNHTYFCLGCGKEMDPNLGPIRKKHFSHRVKGVCDGESYYHKLAKRRIREKFMTSDSFPIIFKRDIPCSERYNCPFYDEEQCISKDVQIPMDLKTWNGEKVYDTCQEEVNVEEFRPDLLLTCSSSPNKKPVFIEVYKTHKSNESKMNSGFKIVETIRIDDDSVIDKIVHQGFIEGDNCKTKNFYPALPSTKGSCCHFERLVLFNNGYSALYCSSCDKLKQKLFTNSVVELNLMPEYHMIDVLGTPNITSHKVGLIYLIKKGYSFKNCILCRYNGHHFIRGYCCFYYKERVIQAKAQTCRRYEVDRNLMKIPLSELEKVVFDVNPLL